MNANQTPRKTNASGVGLQRLVRAPDYCLKTSGLTTQGQWRVKKRKDLKALIQAMKNYRMGCAFCPCKNGEVDALDRLLESMWEAHKEKNWPWRSNDPSSATATKAGAERKGDNGKS